MLATLLLVILQTTVTLPLAVQIVNYVLLVVNFIYTLIMSVVIVPTWREHKALVKDYNDRNSPKYLEAIKEIEDKKKEELKEIILAIKDIKHDINAIRQDKVNLDVVFKQMTEIHEDIHSLRNK